MKCPRESPQLTQEQDNLNLVAEFEYLFPLPPPPLFRECEWEWTKYTRNDFVFVSIVTLLCPLGKPMHPWRLSLLH